MQRQFVGVGVSGISRKLLVNILLVVIAFDRAAFAGEGVVILGPAYHMVDMVTKTLHSAPDRYRFSFTHMTAVPL